MRSIFFELKNNREVKELNNNFLFSQMNIIKEFDFIKYNADLLK